MRQNAVHSFLHMVISPEIKVQGFLWSPSYFKTSTFDFWFESFPAVSPSQDGPVLLQQPAAVGLGLWLPWWQLLQIPGPVALQRFTAGSLGFSFPHRQCPSFSSEETLRKGVPRDSCPVQYCSWWERVPDPPQGNFITSCNWRTVCCQQANLEPALNETVPKGGLFITGPF